ncbi:MAG: LptF/LptG family permease [Fimbriimonadaceae bacterium]
MKRLDRYVLRELLVPFLIGTLAVVLMFDINMLMGITKDYDISNIPKLALAQMILYKTPYFLNMTLPVGMSLGASLAMSRLARESELTAMRCAGARILRVIGPMALFGVLVGFGDLALVEKVMPLSERKFSSLEREFGVLAMMPNLAKDTFVRLEGMQVSIGQTTRTGPDTVVLGDVVIYSRPAPGDVTLIQAARGTYDRGQWILDNAYIYDLKAGDLTRFHESKRWTINRKIGIDDLLLPPQPEEQTAAELRQSIINARRQRLQTQQLEIEYQTRFSVPASCILFAFVAPALAIMFARSGFAGVLLSIFLVFLYYNVFIFTTQILGKNSHISPILAAWAPNVLFAALGLVAIRRLE